MCCSPFFCNYSSAFRLQTQGVLFYIFFPQVKQVELSCLWVFFALCFNQLHARVCRTLILTLSVALTSPANLPPSHSSYEFPYLPAGLLALPPFPRYIHIFNLSSFILLDLYSFASTIAPQYILSLCNLTFALTFLILPIFLSPQFPLANQPCLLSVKTLTVLPILPYGLLSLRSRQPS